MLIGISWRRWRALPRQRLLSLAKTIGWRGTMTAFATWKSDVQIGHRYLTNEYVNLLKCWSWSWFDPRSCQQKLGKQRNHRFFSMQKQHKDHKDPKKQLHCYTDYIGSFGNDPLLSLGSCECWAEVSTQEAFVAYMSPGVVSRVLICDKQSALSLHCSDL